MTTTFRPYRATGMRKWAQVEFTEPNALPLVRNQMEVGRIFLFQPTFHGAVAASHRAFMVGALLQKDSLNGRLNLLMHGSSLLANNFNIAWTAALNEQAKGADITHFAMLHDDIVPADGWLRTLLEDLRDTGADLVSAVVPIKDSRGLTSTAIDNPDDEFQVERRITIAELLRLPMTFGPADCGYPDRQLLVNTGCWVCRFDRPWRFSPHFEIRDRIVYRVKDTGDFNRIVTELMGTIEQRFPGMTPADLLAPGKLLQPLAAELAIAGRLPEGLWSADVNPEDWNFSRMLHKLGCRLVATRRVELAHFGHLPWTNNVEWGEFERDENLLVNKPEVKSILQPMVNGEAAKGADGKDWR